MSKAAEELNKAKEYYNGKQYEKAFSLCKNILKADKNNRDAHYLAAACANNLKDFKACAFHYDHCQEEMKKELTAWKSYALALAVSERWDEAVKAFESVLILDPESTETMFNYGYYLSRNKEYVMALKWLFKAEEYGCLLPKVYVEIGVAYYNMKNFYEAIKYLEKASSMLEYNGELARLLGGAYFAVHNHKKAIENYSKSLYYEPEVHSALHWRLLSRVNLKKNGKITNQKAAQEDADNLLPVIHQYYTLKSKEGKPLDIKKITITDDGQVNFEVLERTDEI